MLRCRPHLDTNLTGLPTSRFLLRDSSTTRSPKLPLPLTRAQMNFFYVFDKVDFDVDIGSVAVFKAKVLLLTFVFLVVVIFVARSM